MQAVCGFGRDFSSGGSKQKEYKNECVFDSTRNDLLLLAMKFSYIYRSCSSYCLIACPFFFLQQGRLWTETFRMQKFGLLMRSFVKVCWYSEWLGEASMLSKQFHCLL